MEQVNQAAESEAKKVKADTATVVKCEDGTEVRFPGKRKMQIAITLAEGALKGVIYFLNGRVLPVDVAAEHTHNFIEYGFGQKVRDNVAGETDVDDMVVATQNQLERFAKGLWNETRERGAFSGASLLIQAIVQLTGRPIADVSAWVSTLSKPQRAAMEIDPNIGPIFRQLKEAKEAKLKNIDTGSLLSGFLAGEAPAADNADSDEDDGESEQGEAEQADESENALEDKPSRKRK